MKSKVGEAPSRREAKESRKGWGGRQRDKRENPQNHKQGKEGGKETMLTPTGNSIPFSSGFCFPPGTARTNPRDKHSSHHGLKLCECALQLPTLSAHSQKQEPTNLAWWVDCLLGPDTWPSQTIHPASQICCLVFLCGLPGCMHASFRHLKTQG